MYFKVLIYDNFRNVDKNYTFLFKIDYFHVKKADEYNIKYYKLLEAILMENNYNSYGSYNKEDDQYQKENYEIKGHNHEFQSSVDYEKDDEGMEHSHHIAGVTGPAIKYGQSHVHKVY